MTRCRCTPRLNRRHIVASTLFAGAGLALPRSVFAQEATPAALTGAITSQTREEFRAEVEEELGYTEAATPGGTYIDANVNDIQTIHPLLAEDGSSLAVVGRIYDQLVGGDVRTGGPAPNGLADYWEIAEDGVTYTFHLNQNAKWHDGTDVTADDVQFSFDALANLDVGSAYSQTFHRRDRVVARDRRAHLRGGGQRTALHLPLRPSDLDHPQAHLGKRPGRRLADRRRRHRDGSVAGGRLGGVEVPGVAAGREHHAGPQRRLLRQGSLPRQPGDPHLAGPDRGRRTP